MGTGFDIATSPEEEGIIPRAVAHLFDGIDKRKHDAKQRNEPLPDFKVTVQFMEVRMTICLSNPRKSLMFLEFVNPFFIQIFLISSNSLHFPLLFLFHPNFPLTCFLIRTLYT